MESFEITIHEGNPLYPQNRFKVVNVYNLRKNGKVVIAYEIVNDKGEYTIIDAEKCRAV